MWLIAGMSDNWFYLGRIGTYPWRSAWQEKWVNRWSVIPTIYTYAVRIVDCVRECWKRSKAEGIPFKKLLWEKRWYLLMTFAEFPVSFLSPKLIQSKCVDANFLSQSQFLPSATRSAINHQHTFTYYLLSQTL